MSDNSFNQNAPQKEVIDLLDSDNDDDTNDEKVILPAATDSRKRKRPPSTTTRLESVYIVLTCFYPLQNDKWGEHAGHETQDTEILAVYANLKDANKHAKMEVDDDDDDDENESDDDDSLFYWQEEDTSEWTARRVWVEEQKLKYSF